MRECISIIDKTLDKVTNVISMSLIYPVSISIIFWVLLMIVYIVARKFFNIGWEFVEEFTRYWLVFIGFFSLAYTMRTKGHVVIGIVTTRLSENVRRVLMVITQSLTMLFVCYLVWRGAQFTMTAYADQMRSEYASNILIWPIRLFVPIGLTALALEVLRNLIRSVTEVVWGTKFREKPEEKPVISKYAID